MIRRLVKDDKEKIRKILVDTHHFNDDEVKVAIELIDDYLDDKKQEDYIIQVYETDDTNTTAGYICYGKRPLTDMTYDLYWIAVAPDIHGKGIGSSLVRFMEKDLKSQGGNLILIDTSGKESYANERKFYVKNGYEVQTIIKDFYRRGDDLVMYRKYLI